MKTMLMLIALAALPHAVQAQTQAQAQQSTQGSADARIEAALAAAARANIPVSLLESRVNYGRARQYPPERIAAAVEARLDALIRASSALSRSEIRLNDAGELSVAADAIEAGVDQRVLVRVMRSAPQDQRAVATVVLTQLVQLGYESEPAFLRVNTAIAAGADALANLSAEVSAAIRIRGVI